MRVLTANAEAVFLFEEGKSLREMLYQEFEAVLDGFVPLPEYASRTVRAVYLRIGAGPVVRAAVFFLIDFDAAGQADRRWNLPIAQLVAASPEGPDLGAGPIRLACRSQCAIAWHQQRLWDPRMDAQFNHLALIKKAVQRNRLGLIFEDAAGVPTLKAAQTSSSKAADTGEESRREQAWRLKLAQAIKESRLRVATLQEHHRDQLDQLSRRHTIDLQSQQTLAGQLQLQLEESREQVARLAAERQQQEEKINSLRDYFEQRLQNAQNVDSNALATLKTHLENARQQELEGLRSEFGEQLQRKEIELMYQSTQVAGLQDEIRRLQKDKQELLGASGHNLLEKMHTAGISFVTFQLGAGHMTLPLDDVAAFLENRDAYVAARCQVSEQQLRIWRDHYQQPVCQHTLEGGAACGTAVSRVDTPAAFVEGISNRCQQHAQLTPVAARTETA